MKSILRSLTLAALLWAGTALAQDEVTITYWQYDYPSKVEAINTLIEQFEEANPNINVEHQTFPYDAFQTQVAAAIPAGQGPDVVNLFYGWLPAWVDAGYLISLPDEHFDVGTIESEFIPTVEAASFMGEYWGLPTAVRNLALFYNKELFEEAGIDGPPETWAEFIETAKALTVQQNGQFQRIGYGVAPGGQDHNLVRQVLVEQFGGQPYSDDYREVTYDSPEGTEAFEFYTGWVTEAQIGVPNFLPGGSSGGGAGYRICFMTERCAMVIDGSFAIDTFQEGASFEWGVAELPVLEETGIQSNFSSFWMHGLTPLAQEDPQVLEASAKFLQFITSAETMQMWLEQVGELPARAALVDDPELSNDPIYGAFIRALPYSTSTFFVNEGEQRRILIDATTRVWEQGTNPAAALEAAAKEEQLLLDSFWSDVGEPQAEVE